MTHSHTKGPWRYNPDHIAVFDADKIRICTLPDLREGREERGNLIAAAPELLEALEIADIALARCDIDAVGAARIKIRKTIKKAKGL